MIVDLGIYSVFLSIQKEYENLIQKFPEQDILKLKKDIITSQNNIYILGVGKSETISLHLTNLLKSIGIKVFNLNVLNALHGDIGTLKENDLVIMFSKSGNTFELLELSKFIKKKKCKIWGVCCEFESLFNKICDEVIVLPLIKELEGKTIKTLPTNSCLVQIIFSNILTILIEKEISLTLEGYRNNHPAGSIGNKLKKIKDIIIYNFPIINIKDILQVEQGETKQNEQGETKQIQQDETKKEILLQEVLLQMTQYSIGFCFFINEQKELVGVLSDGDIRRLLLNDMERKYISINDINTDFYYETDMNKLVSDITLIKRKKFIPILSNDMRMIGIIKF
jgi:arabinose-5-phosphate isomerase